MGDMYLQQIPHNRLNESGMSPQYLAVIGYIESLIKGPALVDSEVTISDIAAELLRLPKNTVMHMQHRAHQTQTSPPQEAGRHGARGESRL